MWLPHRTSRETEIREMTVNPGEMIIFTNHCFHAGGANNTNEEQIRLFAYLVSNESHFPSGTVTTWDWEQISADPLITKPSNSYNALSKLTTDKYTRLTLRTGRIATSIAGLKQSIPTLTEGGGIPTLTDGKIMEYSWSRKAMVALATVEDELRSEGKLAGDEIQQSTPAINTDETEEVNI
jgi:hypothetical protein